MTLTIVPAAQLGPQLHHNHIQPSPDHFVAPRMTFPAGSQIDVIHPEPAPNKPAAAYHWVRRFQQRLRGEPIGGLWTFRSFDENPLVGLWRWQPPGSKYHHSTWWTITPEPSAQVLILRTPADVAAAIAAYPYKGTAPDLNYEALARTVAGVHYDPPDYLAGVRDVQAGRSPLPSWIPGSTCWLRWCFTRIDHLHGPLLPPHLFDHDPLIMQRRALVAADRSG